MKNCRSCRSRNAANPAFFTKAQRNADKANIVRTPVHRLKFYKDEDDQSKNDSEIFYDVRAHKSGKKVQNGEK